MPTDLFDTFQPDAESLLRRIAPQIDDAMLMTIAQQDYGQNAEQHLHALRRIRDKGVFELPLPWHPGEVLELVRWWPAPAVEMAVADARRHHWIRAFCCTALLRASAGPGEPALRDAWSETLSPLIDSLQALESGLDREAAAFLAWLILRFETDEKVDSIGFLGIGLLWFALQLGSGIADATLVALAEWIVAQEENVAARSKIFGTPWLFTASAYRQHPRGWGRLGAALQALDLTRHGEPVRVWVRLIGRELSTE